MGLEPTALIQNIGLVELLVGFGEVDNTLNQADDGTNGTTAKYAQGEHNDALSGIAENELVNAEAPQQNAANTAT